MDQAITTADLEQLAKDLVQGVKDGIQTIDDVAQLTNSFSAKTVKLLLSFIHDLTHLDEDICKTIMDAIKAFHDIVDAQLEK